MLTAKYTHKHNYISRSYSQSNTCLAHIHANGLYICLTCLPGYSYCVQVDGDNETSRLYNSREREIGDMLLFELPCQT